MTLNRNLILPNTSMKNHLKNTEHGKLKDGDVSKKSATSRTFYDKLSTVDWPSLSDTGWSSPDLSNVNSDSDSSASSIFSWADSEATEDLIEEWNKIERTLYDEPGPKVRSKILLEECDQWKIFFPHLRILGTGMPTEITDRYCETEENVNGYLYCEREIGNNIPSRLKKLKNFSFEDNLESAQHFGQISQLNLSGRSVTETPRNIMKTIPRITPVILSPSAVHRLPGQLILQSEILSSRWRKRDTSILSPSFYPSRGPDSTNREKSSSSIYSEVNTPNSRKLRLQNVENSVINENKLIRTNKNKIHLPPISANSTNKKIINNNKSIYKRSDTLVPLDSKQCVSNIPICAKIKQGSSKLVNKNSFV